MPAVSQKPLQWLRKRDPQWYALQRACEAAVVVPVNFAIGSQLIGNVQVATFAAFGSFALLLFVTFPGSRQSRLGAYLVLGVTGVALISLGTLVASPDWLAVIGMGVVTFAVLFTGVISSMINAGTQAALLSFILAVMLPGSLSSLPDRLAGWGIAFAVAVPVALFVRPVRDQDELRAKAAALCRGLAAMLRLDQPSSGDSLVSMRRAARDLQAAFRTSSTRTRALSTGARVLVRLVDELEWLATTVTNACADEVDGWPEQGLRLREAATRVVEACAAVLDGPRPDRGACSVLDKRIAELQDARRAVSAEALAQLRSSATGTTTDGAVRRGEFGRPLYAAHELGYAVTLAAGTVSVIAAADSRSWWDRLLGRGLDEPDAASQAQRVAGSHLDRHSVWLQNSVRAAIGLAGAVLVSRIVDAQNAFWVGLGALSVLRSNALSTGATVVRALVGTAIGFVIGGAAVVVLGTSPAVLWPLLPLIIFVAASAPSVISFVAGQAAFTVFTIVLFNILAPSGWTVGVLRVEDVALGCAASLVAGVLFWPRGAAAALAAAIGDAYRTSADVLQNAVHAVAEPVDGASPRPTGDVTGDAVDDAVAAGARLDDALRQYLAERGAKEVPLETVAALANGATRVRLAGTAIAELRDSAPDGLVVPADDDRLAGPAHALAHRGDEVAGWYRELAAGIERLDTAVPSACDAHDGSFLDVVLPAVDGCGDVDRAARAEQLLWSGQYLGDVDRLRSDLIDPAATVRATRSRSWWQR